MPSGPLGVTIVDNEAGVYVQNKSSDRTELLGRDTIRCVGFVPVKTITECTKAIQNDFHSKNTLTIERNVSKSVGESNMEQDRLPLNGVEIDNERRSVQIFQDVFIQRGQKGIRLGSRGSITAILEQHYVRDE